MSTQRTFLVVGCGSIGKRHIGNLLERQVGTVVGFDVREDRRAEVEEKFGIATCGSLDEAWALKPKVVFVTAPTSLHAPIALAAAERGCHLFIEKPLADRLERLDALCDEVRRRGLVTLVGCNMRFHPGLRTLKRLLDEGAIGRVVAARAHFGQYLPDWHPWEDYRQSYSARQDLGGGIILDDIHELDYVRWLLGEVRTVACFADKLTSLELETEDTAAMLLRFESGAIGEVHVDYVQRAYGRACHVIGEGGTLEWDVHVPLVRWYSAERRAWTELPLPEGWTANQMYLDELDHFLACLDGTERSTQDVVEARRVLTIALAAKESAATGRILSME